MKYLVVLALLALVFFLWQAKRRADRSPKNDPKPASRPQPLPPTDMVACAVCQVHLPRHEALALKGASYCCEAHRQEGADA